MNGTAVLFSIAIPLAAAVLITASETLTSPSHAEHHNRKRSASTRWQHIEVVAGCAFGVIVAVVLVGCLVFLWTSRPSW
jgi:hypothetical protein